MRFVRHVLVPCCLFLALEGCKPRAEPEPILIGHVAPFSGPERMRGEQARQAILLAVEHVNKEENRIGQRRVGVLHIDVHENLEALQPATVRLIKVNQVVALLGGGSAAQVEQVGRAAQPYQVGLITPAAVPTEVLGENVFSINASLGFQGQVLARFAATDLKAARAAILADGRRAASLDLAEAFSKEFSKGGGQAPRQCVYKSAADLPAAVLDSKAATPQVICYAGTAVDLPNARKALQDAGLTTPLLWAADAEQRAFEPSSKATADIYFATLYPSEGGTPEQQAFAKEYKDRFLEPPSTEGLLAYDGSQVLLQAVRRAKTIEAAKVLAELAGGEDFDSLTGRLAFSKDHAARRPLFVVRLENGVMRDAKRFDPETK